MDADGRTMRERMLAGDLYIANDPDLARENARAQALLHRLNTMDPADRAGRHATLRELLGSFGDGSEILPPFRCDYGYQIFVGTRTFINYGFVCLDVARVIIGDDVQVGPNVQLLTATHPVDPEPRRAKWESARPITIGDNAWLGGGVIVCPGVSIGPDSVIGAGSVVTRDIPAGVVAAGSPARILRRVDEAER
jgi:maltose O-acetyltransferase